MKAEEMMIGDWIWTTRPYGSTNAAIFQIETIESSCGVKNGVLATYREYDEIFPIPLTPEILEKNQFSYKGDEEFGRYYFTTTSVFEVQYSRGEFWGKCMNEDITLDYVHELQHALRLCGLTNLANNLKIE